MCLYAGKGLMGWEEVFKSSILYVLIKLLLHNNFFELLKKIYTEEFKACSKSSASYFIIFAHNARSGCW